MYKHISDWLKKNSEYQSVRLAVCDLNGILRGKRVPSGSVNKILHEGSRMPLSTSCIDIWGNDLLKSPFLFESGDADGMVFPTGQKLIPVNWLDNPTVILPAWIYTEDGQPSLIDPRHLLQRVLDKFSEFDLSPMGAFELEFYLLDGNSQKIMRAIDPVSKKRLVNTSVLSIDELDSFENFFSEVLNACTSHGVSADTIISENAAGQFEINLKHTSDLLNAADQAVFFKRIIKMIARKHNFKACFMSKPFLDSAGNGMHLHLSLLDNKNNNIFDDGTVAGSEKLRNAVAGLLKTMATSTLIFAPHLNSFRRLKKGTHAPTAVCWGYENRTASIRIPGGASKNIRLEHRVAGADANPYLVAAAVLMGTLHGIKFKLKPPAPLQGDSYSKNLPQLPTNWAEAINIFQNSELNQEFYSQTFVEVFTNYKIQELETFSERMEEFEYSTYSDCI